MANNNDQNVIQIRESSPSQGISAVTSPPRQTQRVSISGHTKSQFTPAKVSHIRDESGVTYRVVQIPTDFLSQGAQITTLPSTQVITTNQGQAPDIVGGSGQQVFLNANFVSSPETKIAYLPSNTAITVASPIATAQPQIQLQAVDGGGGQQYYIMIPPGDLVQAGTSISQGRATAQVITAPRMQQAAFIPLSKLDSSPSSSQASSQSVTIGQAYLSEQMPVQKETKRRVSHNEVEKRRRDKINSWINKLARLVPSACDDASKQGQSKGGILAKTVDYINELRNTNAHLVEALDSSDTQRLRQQVNELTRENKMLRQKLTEHGIPTPHFQSGSSVVQQQQVLQAQTSSGQVPVVFATATKRLIPVTMIVSSEANMATITRESREVDEDEDNVAHMES